MVWSPLSTVEALFPHHFFRCETRMLSLLSRRRPSRRRALACHTIHPLRQTLSLSPRGITRPGGASSDAQLSRHASPHLRLTTPNFNSALGSSRADGDVGAASTVEASFFQLMNVLNSRCRERAMPNTVHIKANDTPPQRFQIPVFDVGWHNMASCTDRQTVGRHYGHWAVVPEAAQPEDGQHQDC